MHHSEDSLGKWGNIDRKIDRKDSVLGLKFWVSVQLWVRVQLIV